MDGKIEAKKLLIIMGYLSLGFIFIILFPNDSNYIIKQSFLVNTLAYFIMTGLFLIIFFKSRLDILDPIVFVSAIYIALFVIVPNIDILNGETIWFGVNLFDNAVKGTIIAAIGYFAFCVGYTIRLKKINVVKSRENKQVKQYDKNKIVFTSIFIWFICLTLSVIFLVINKGMSLTYIFTLGFIGGVDTMNVSSTPLGAISMFSYSLIPSCLVYNYYGKSKSLKILLFSLTLIVLLLRGFRFIVIILILSFIIFYYLKSGKRPSGKVISVMLIFLILLVAFMGFIRTDLKTGGTVLWSEFSWVEVREAILGNFRIYNTYYAVIKVVPSQIPYMLGSQMLLYTIIMFIPRAIWPGKPTDGGGGEAISLGISQYALEAGQAYPGIGEYYYEFGIIGVVLLMWLFGYLMKQLKIKYLLHRRDEFDLIVYSILVATTLQLIIRGYTPSNFYLVLFLVLPVILIKKMSQLTRKEGKKSF